MNICLKESELKVVIELLRDYYSTVTDDVQKAFIGINLKTLERKLPEESISLEEFKNLQNKGYI